MMADGCKLVSLCHVFLMISGLFFKQELNIVMICFGRVLFFLINFLRNSFDANYFVLIYQLKALGIDNILGFDWPASPSPEAMIRALEVLYSLGVLDDDAKLTTPAGFQVAEIPLVCCQ